MVVTRETTSELRVLVVDDHTTFAELMSMALDAEPDLTCVDHARSAEQALELDRRHQPDVVVMDVNMPGVDGVTATRMLIDRRPDVCVVVLSAQVGPALVAAAVAAGASAVLPKDGALNDLLAAIRTARRGQVILSPSALAAGNRSAEVPVSLTPRERAVLEMLGDGLDAQGIARRLGISLNTCRGYVKTLLFKLDAHSQLEAVATARRLGLIGDRGFG